MDEKRQIIRTELTDEKIKRRYLKGYPDKSSKYLVSLFAILKFSRKPE